jgi:hypothetical protein
MNGKSQLLTVSSSLTALTVLLASSTAIFSIVRFSYQFVPLNILNIPRVIILGEVLPNFKFNSIKDLIVNDIETTP